MASVYGKAQNEAIPGQQPRLLDRLRQTLRTKHYAYNTEQAYVHWVLRYILFHDKRHPQDLGGSQIEAFLTDLAVAGRVSASTLMQALCAILFLYKHVLRIDHRNLWTHRTNRQHPRISSYSMGIDLRSLWPRQRRQRVAESS